MSAFALDVSRSPRSTPDFHLHLVPRAAQGGYGERLRVTRRGWLALAMVAVSAVLALFISLVGVSHSATASSEVVVQPGQTLSEVAATHLPHLPLDRAIVAVQRENAMNTLQVQAGQVLHIP